MPTQSILLDNSKKLKYFTPDRKNTWQLEQAGQLNKINTVAAKQLLVEKDAEFNLHSVSSGT